MLRIGASSCLLGHRVRYDGGHKRHGTVTETLSHYFEIIAVCPEMEVGMGVPREPVDLIGDPLAPRMMGQRSGRDWSGTMERHARRRAAEMERLGVCGFVLKTGSPSCGPDGVPVRARWGEAPVARGLHAPPATAPGTASGLFARALTDALPLLPVEAEDRLDDASVCEHFIERVHAYREWRECEAEGPSMSRLQDFHASHKLTLLAHSETHLRLLGRLLAEAGDDATEAVATRYGSAFMEALKQPGTRGTNANALEHLAGFLSARLDRDSRQRLALLVHDYRVGKVPLSAPVALIRRHAAEHQVDYVLRQSFLRAPATRDPL
ncbi:MAG: DUF523 and DUF1722 domain-containing protein [Deltaproteobacteria bacterium]|nr:DUF523 and DUF1722 domain-containing protein [Deltaproteobacteria bacterium]